MSETSSKTKTAQEVLNSAKQLFTEGFVVATAGNVSGRKSSGVVITPSSIPYETMALDDLVHLDAEGNQTSEKHSPSTETQIHLECYAAHPEVGGVVHSHPRFASMFAVAQEPIPAAIEEVIVYLGGDIEVADYHQTGSRELAEHLAGQLGNKSAVLMANHGLLCVGKSPAEALKATQIVERTAEIVWGAQLLEQKRLGEKSPPPPKVPIPEKVIEDFKSVYLFVRAEMWE